MSYKRSVFRENFNIDVQITVSRNFNLYYTKLILNILRCIAMQLIDGIN